MRYRNNLTKVTMAFIFCTFILLSYNQIKSQNTNSNNIDDSKKINMDKIINKTYNKEWKLAERARYIQGTIVSLKQSSDGIYILNLKVEENYHSVTDPVEDKNYPFKIGKAVKFILKDKPKICLINNNRIIVYEGKVTTNGSNYFFGADVMYYEKSGKYYDMNKKEVKLPLHDYPNSL